MCSYTSWDITIGQASKAIYCRNLWKSKIIANIFGWRLYKEPAFWSFHKKALLHIQNCPSLCNVLLLMTVCTLTIMTVNSYTQPLLLSKGMNLKLLGFLMLGYNFLMALGANISKKYRFRICTILLPLHLASVRCAVGFLAYPAASQFLLSTVFPMECFGRF